MQEWHQRETKKWMAEVERKALIVCCFQFAFILCLRQFNLNLKFPMPALCLAAGLCVSAIAHIVTATSLAYLRHQSAVGHSPAK